MPRGNIDCCEKYRRHPLAAYGVLYHQWRLVTLLAARLGIYQRRRNGEAEIKVS